MSDENAIYEMSINARISWQAHSLSNVGSNGSNRLLPRRQLLSDGTETDACSGNIAKHYHASLLTEKVAADGGRICPACLRGDGRRAAALIALPEYKNLNLKSAVTECVVCDTHGFLLTGKKGEEGKSADRERVSKHTTVEYAFALALPTKHAESDQLMARGGNSKDGGQMLMKMVARSGEYALCVRNKCAAIGNDLESGQQLVKDPKERQRRHHYVLEALRDQFLSPSGAMTATMLPHLSGLKGAIVIRRTPGRAFVYSPLEEDFIEQLQGMSVGICEVRVFQSAAEFSAIMSDLATSSTPYTVPQYAKGKA